MGKTKPVSYLRIEPGLACSITRYSAILITKFERSFLKDHLIHPYLDENNFTNLSKRVSFLRTPTALMGFRKTSMEDYVQEILLTYNRLFTNK